MAAPQIPNLLSLRGGSRSRGAGRGRGRGGNSMAAPAILAEAGRAQDDNLIRETDHDASVSRLSAVSLGYLHDSYAREFAIRDNTPRRLPIINRGTYVRTTAIDTLVEAFLSSNKDVATQIISLGAGTDTRYWRFREKQLHLNVLYHEIDFPSVSKNKFCTIRSSKVLSPQGSAFFALHDLKPDFKPHENRWGFLHDSEKVRSGYLFHPIDLREMPSHIDDILTDVPTLLLSECCLCYMSPDEAWSVIKTFTNFIPNLGMVIYEPTNPYSEFGQVMIKNLAARGLSMQTIHKYPTLQSQLERLREAGFTHAQNGADMLWLWRNWVSEEEKERVATLEMMDELEEWELLAEHYLIIWGWREAGEGGGHFKQWMERCPGKVPYPELPKEAILENAG